MEAKLKEIKRVISDEELVAEIREAMKDPVFRKVVRDFVRSHT